MPSDHLALLHDVGELAALLAGSADLESFLCRIVEMIARHLEAEVCSIYLYEEKRQALTLRATHGLNPEAVGRVSLKLGEGLTGLALKELRPVCEKCASRNPRYKRVPVLREEGYESFLAVPIHRGVERIGVLVAQRSEERPFNDDDVMALRATTMQLASAIENARLLMSLHAAEPPRLAADQEMQLIRGKVASEGYAFGPALPLPSDSDPLAPAQPRPDFACTLDDFQAALRLTMKQLEDLQERLKEKLPEAASLIFTAHFMMLKDSRFTGEMASRIQRGEAPHAAVLAVARYYIGLFSASPHAYLREKANDVEDLAKRILANLGPRSKTAPSERAGRVVIAAALYPSDVLWLASENVSGIVLVSGGLTAHVSLIARSLGIPLLIADRPDLLSLAEGTPVLLDAEAGNFYVKPSEEVIKRFKEREQARLEVQPALAAMPAETRTADGTRIKLLANINLLSEVRLAMELRADGIGLYRTEFPFLIRTAFPAEEEQLPVYTSLLRQANGKEVTIRTLDLGSDKLLLRGEGREENPALGLRSTRFLLRYRDILGQQLRAILRAAAGHQNLRILFPMISSLDEFREARAE
ncbi:MAG: GAF domain-containing protein, partial [Planctomycetota bacterium]|nr:GAF domain-containing protein [Planctomycetota bacterium]